jgi:5-methyltetrahydropteroyltriglutamate--homocysteine methyltransferase
MLETTIAGSLPKPAWLAKPRMLWAPWQVEGEALVEAKRDATLLALKEQEDAGIDIVTDGEQARQHFVHGFLERIEGVDFARRVTMGIRNNRYNAEVPTVSGPLRRKSNVHGFEAKIARAHTRRRLKFTLPGPMTIVDTIADAHYGDKVALAMAFAAVLNEEARELAEIGVDVVQFDEPAFNVYMQEVTEWGIAALHRAAEDLPCKTAVHICYGYGIKANIDWKSSLGAEWRQYEAIFPALATSRIDQVSVECAGAKVPLDLLGLLNGKEVLLGAIDVANEHVETPEEVAATIEQASRFVPMERIYPCTNCARRRWIARWRSANLSRSAPAPRSPVGGSKHTAGEGRARNKEQAERWSEAGCICRPLLHRSLRLVPIRQRSNRLAFGGSFWCSDPFGRFARQSCHTGEGRYPWHTWVPAFAGKTRTGA